MVRLLVTQADYGAKWLLEHENIATKFILAATPILELHILSFLPIFEIYIFIKHFLIVLIVPI
jgi:hypothetical protein